MPRFNPLIGFLRPQCPNPAIAVASGGNLTAGSLWLGIVRQNRIGFDIASPLQQITWTTGQKVVITLPSTLRVNDSEDVHRIWILAGTTSTVGQSSPLTCWRGYTLTEIGSTGYFNEVRSSLPATIELTENAHLQIGAVAANPAALLTIAALKDGMQRFVTSLNKLFYYDPLSTRTVDNNTVLSAGANPGQWLQWPLSQLFSLGSITDTTGINGANRDSRAVVDADILLPPPRYKMDGTNSPWVQYTLFNGTTESGTPIDAGTRLVIDILQSGLPKSQLFSDRVIVKVLGVSRFSDGSLSTAGITTGAELTYQYGQPLYALEQDLQPGYGLTIAIALRVNAFELDGDVQNGLISVKPYFSKISSNPNPAQQITGDVILAVGDRRRVYPKRGAIARIGSGSVTMNYRVSANKAAFDFVIPSTGVTGQKITINDNADIFWRGTAALLSSERQRAIVGLGTGRSNPSPWSAYTAYGATDSADVTIVYPTAIRADYPDVAIANAGSAQGAEFNAPLLVLYVQRQSDGQIREFANNATLVTASQTFNVSNFAAGTVIGSLPTTANDFGCWAAANAPSTAIVSGGGSIGAASYRFAYAFRYTGGTLTDIDHGVANGNLAEAAASYGEMSTQITTLQTTVNNWVSATPITLSALRSLSRPIPTGKAYFLTDSSIRRVVWWDDTLTGSEDGSGVFKLTSDSSTSFGRFVIDISTIPGVY